MPNTPNPTEEPAGRLGHLAKDVTAGLVGGAAGAAVVPAAAPAVLGLVGFSSAGPVAGTLAAVIQSSIGSVAAGSPFAVAQAIAMGGCAVPVVGFVIGGATAAGVMVGAARMLNGRKPNNDNPQDKPGEHPHSKTINLTTCAYIKFTWYLRYHIWNPHFLSHSTLANTHKIEPPPLSQLPARLPPNDHRGHPDFINF